MNTQTKIIKITDEEAEERLDVFLSSIFSEYSRSKIQKLIGEEKILVNDKQTKNSYKLRENDVIKIFDEEEISTIEPENIPLDIRYKDENLLVVNKPKNMLTHPTANEKNGQRRKCQEVGQNGRRAGSARPTQPFRRAGRPRPAAVEAGCPKQ